MQACFQAAGPLALRSCFGMVPTANLFQLRSSFRSAAKDEARDFSCHWSLDSLPTRFLRRTGHGMLRDWNMDTSVVSLLTQQPRALQKHPRLLVTIRKRILGQIPAVGTRGAMQITQTSHAQRPQRQICSLWYSILISESLPLVTLV